MLFIGFVVLSCCALLTVAEFNLTILHTNDVHDRIEPTNKYSAACSEKDEQADKCYGGYARLIGKVKDLKDKYPNSIVLDGGDQFQGTTWFYKYGGNVTAYFMNLLGYDAMVLGNHEFDNNIEGLVTFLEGVKFPVLNSNIDASNEPTIEGKFEKSRPTILDVGGEKLAVIGYTTVDTPSISSTGDLIFKDEIESIRTEIQSIKTTNPSIKKFIALGHAGFQRDQEIGEQIEEIDIVVGGHTNTFLYTGTPPSNEKAEGDYPFVVTKPSGKKALCVQDYAYGKYLGFLNVIFDDQGDLISWNGNPILLDETVPQDENVLSQMQPWKKVVDDFQKTIAGETLVLLQGDVSVCRQTECNLGNAILNGLIKSKLKTGNDMWNNLSIAIINSGGIQATLEQGIITFEDVSAVLPFRHTISLIDLHGSDLLEVLEHSVSLLSPQQTDEFSGRFLQYSGLRVKYNLYKPVGKRVVDVKVLCTECEIPEFEEFDKTKVFRIILPEFLVKGGDDFTMIPEKLSNLYAIGELTSDIFIDYLRKHSPINQGLDGRIEFVTDGVEDSCSIEMN